MITTKIQNGRQRSTPNFFVGAKNPKFKIRKLFKFYYHIPHDVEMCKYFFKVLLKFKMAAMDKLHIFLLVQKLKNLSQ